MKVPVTKEILFSLMHSHSRLSQAEYERNPSYNNSHFSAVVEDALIKDLPPELFNEYRDYVDMDYANKHEEVIDHEEKPHIYKP